MHFLIMTYLGTQTTDESKSPNFNRYNKISLVSETPSDSENLEFQAKAKETEMNYNPLRLQFVLANMDVQSCDDVNAVESITSECGEFV